MVFKLNQTTKTLKTRLPLAASVLSFAACNANETSITKIPAGMWPESTPGCITSSHSINQYHGSILANAHTQASNPRIKTLEGNVPMITKYYSDLGKVSDKEELPFTITLKLKNEEELDREILAIYQPGNPKYHNFLTPEEFRERYAPTEEQVARVQSYLLSAGMHLDSVSENRLLIRASGSVERVNSYFNTEIHRFHDAQNKMVFAPAYEPQLPEDLPIEGIHGLQNVIHLKTHSVKLKSNLTPHGSTGPNGGFSPSDIRKAYNIPNSLTGAGQTLALFELDGFENSDIQKYESEFGLPEVPLETILVGDADGSTGPAQAEVSLDLELMIAIAPGVDKILIYEGKNYEQGILDTYARIANDNRAKSISTSWGLSEDQASSSFSRAENSIFKQMALQGQTIYAAAGDNGAYDNGSKLSVDDPASQPFVVGVGGTTLTTHPDGSYLKEVTWGSGSQGGGGGISANWTIPEWQKGLSTQDNLSSASMRNVPDVALNSNPQTGYSIYNNGKWAVFGGTSAAAPLWAAFTALVNQQRQSNRLSSLGFANPHLYLIGKQSLYSASFFDIADGSTNLYYPARKGYDNATGWGSFNGEGLLQILAKDPSLTGELPSGGCPVFPT